MKWTEEQTINFVMEYLKYECLYNINSEQYKTKKLRNAALLKISQTMDIIDFGPKEVYQKIRSIKSTYFQELKKIRNSLRSDGVSGDIYKPNVKWFNILHEGLTAVNNNNTSECKETSSFEAVSLPEVQLVEDQLEDDNGSTSNEETTVGANEAGSQINNLNSIVNKGIIRKNPMKRILKDYDNVYLLSKVQNVAKTEAAQSENEFDIFGMSIAAQLKNMPLDMAVEAQMFIQNYLSEMRLRTLQRTMYDV